MDTIHCFAPIADSHSEKLILGSIPGVESLRKGQYYGHERNGFWRIVYALFNTPYEDDYGRRTQFLLHHKIALWDVIGCCQRHGSLDSSIRQPQVNDFAAFFAAHPRIQSVYFNGRKAYTLFEKSVGFGNTRLQYTYLWSTSPAHAKPFEQKVANWQKIME